MPDVTYYFNSKSTSVWTDHANWIDNVVTNYASTTVDAATEILDGNTCPGDDLGTITKVEIRVYAYGDVDDQLTLTPVFDAAEGDAHPTVPGVGAGWGAYQDITSDTNAPDWSAWSQIQTIDVKAALNDVSKGNTMYGSKVEIRVTYWVPPVSDIDVGATPADRTSFLASNATYVDKNNPANASGTLHSVKVWVNHNITGLRVGTFYTTNGNTLKCRDSVVLGDVVAGAERTFTELSINVQAGDYIGCYFTAGDIDVSLFGDGNWWIDAEYIDPNDESLYYFQANRAISLYGYGDIVGIPENTVYLVKATGQRTQLSAGAVPIKIDPATGRRSTDPSFPKFLVREDDGTLRAKSA